MLKLESRNPNYRAYTEYKIGRNKFIPFLGFEITKIEPGYIEGELLFREVHEQQNGWLHGGITSAMLDMVEGFAAYTLALDGQQIYTVEAKVSYFNPGRAPKFFARGYIVKPGKRFHFCEGEVYYIDEKVEEVIVAKGSSTMAVV